MKIWIDDLRVPAEGWLWAKSSQEAIDMLDELLAAGGVYDIISFDHDLGGDDTSRRVMNWIIENQFFPTTEVRIHTANPVGKGWLVGTAERYMPEHVRVWK